MSDGLARISKGRGMTKCRECDGTGEKFVLPRGNPFNMKLPILTHAMRKVQCFHCHGDGYVRSAGLNIGKAPWPEGYPTD